MSRLPSLLSLLCMTICVFGSTIIPVSAYVDDTECLQLTDGYLCLTAETNNNSIHFSNTITNYTRSDIPQLTCQITTPNNISLPYNTCSSYVTQDGNGDYRIYGTLNNDNFIFMYNSNNRTFSSAVEWNSTTNSNNYGSYADLTADDYTINAYQSIDLSVRAYNNNTTRTNYNGQVRFSVYRRDGGYGFSTASLSDYSFNGNSSYYTFSIYDNGYHTFYDHIAFNRDGEYKIRVEWDNLTADEITVTVWAGYTNNNNSNNNTNTTNFSLTVDDSTPDINQNIYATVTALNSSYSRDYNYRNTVSFAVERRDTSYGSWYSASPSTDYILTTSSYYMGSTEQWLVSSLNIVRFVRSGYYRIRTYDASNTNIQGYSNEISVNNTTTNNNGRRFDLTSNNTNLSSNQWTNIAITAKDTYNNTDTAYNSRMNFKVYRRASSSDNRTDITSSTLDNSNYSIYASYYIMPYSIGYVNLSSFIRFYDNNYDYRVVVEDNNDPSGMRWEIIYYVKNAGNNPYPNNNNSSTVRLSATIDPTLPKKNNDIDVTLSARDSSNRQVSNYSNRVNFVMEKKSSAWSRSWSIASSSDCTLDETSYTFSSNDNGDVELNDLIKCKKDGFFRLKITDNTNSSVKWYVYITILTTSKFDSKVTGYSTNQLKTIKSVYTNFMNTINSYENTSARLYNDSTRETTWTDFYQKLYDVVYDRSGKDLTSYSRYQDAIRDFNNVVLSRR